MSETSWLTDADVADLKAVNRSGVATMLTVQEGGTSLVLSRWNDAQQKHVALPAQTVVMTWEDQPREITAPSGKTVVVSGWFRKATPFDVEVADRFSIGDVGDELPGTIEIVLPAHLGVQRAGFALGIEER